MIGVKGCLCIPTRHTAAEAYRMNRTPLELLYDEDTLPYEWYMNETCVL
jgi:hypothetical protein